MGFMFPTAIVPGNRLTVGEKQKSISNRRGTPTPSWCRTPGNLVPRWKITKGEERVQLDADGNLALSQEKQRFKERFQDSPQIRISVY